MLKERMVVEIISAISRPAAVAGGCSLVLSASSRENRWMEKVEKEIDDHRSSTATWALDHTREKLKTSLRSLIGMDSFTPAPAVLAGRLGILGYILSL